MCKSQERGKGARRLHTAPEEGRGGKGQQIEER